jgi:predicted ferric reductase
MTDQLLWYTTRAAGAVSLVLLTGVVVLGILSALRFRTSSWPGFLTTGLHRNIALVALVFLALHIVTAIIDPFTSLGWLPAVIPFSSYYRTFWLGLGTIAFELLLAIVVTSLVRGFVGHSAWRAIHWLTYAAWPIAVVHGFGTGTDAWSVWFMGLAVVCVGMVGIALVYRLVAPARDPLAAQRANFRSAVERRQDP